MDSEEQWFVLYGSKELPRSPPEVLVTREGTYTRTDGPGEIYTADKTEKIYSGNTTNRAVFGGLSRNLSPINLGSPTTVLKRLLVNRSENVDTLETVESKERTFYFPYCHG